MGGRGSWGSSGGWGSPSSPYGRRRVGKTALVLKFLEERPHFYFFVNPREPPAFFWRSTARR